jgi:hypothetical protein
MGRRSKVLSVARLVPELGAEVGLLVGSAVTLNPAQLRRDIVALAFFLLLFFLVGVVLGLLALIRVLVLVLDAQLRLPLRQLSVFPGRAAKLFVLDVGRRG